MSSRVRHCQVREDPLSVDRLLAAVRDPAVGGIALFIGTVRDFDENRTVRSLDYTGHPTAGERLRESADRVAEAHDVVAVAVEHRLGHLEVGDPAVVVAVGAVHRAEAFAACRALIDDLKAEVPIWKEQHFESGTVGWVGLG